MYDLIIIGAGPAGLTASIYASRYKLKNLVIGQVLGGTITLAHKVQNFPGFAAIAGADLGQKMVDQVKALGVEILAGNVDQIEKSEAGFKVMAENGQALEGKALIIASGTERRKLNVPGEDKYLGRGVSYCTTCDAAFFRDKAVALIGGSNAACGGAVHLAGFAQKVYIIYRRDQLRAEPAWVEEALSHPKIEVIYNTNVVKILGKQEIKKIEEETKKLRNQETKKPRNQAQDRVAAVELDNPYKEAKILKIDGLFIEIGGAPVSDLVRQLGVKIDENGYVEADQKMATSVAGIFAAGDVTTASGVLQQAITACAQGAVAAASVFNFVKGQKAPRILGEK